MFFRRKACEVCQSKDATIRQLEEKLSSALAEIRSLKVSPDASPDRSIETETAFYDKSLDWHRMELQEIEREIQNIYSKFGRTKGAIAAVNELQYIQQSILKETKPNFSSKKRQESDSLMLQNEFTFLANNLHLFMEKGGNLYRSYWLRSHPDQPDDDSLYDPEFDFTPNDAPLDESEYSNEWLRILLSEPVFLNDHFQMRAFRMLCDSLAESISENSQRIKFHPNDAKVVEVSKQFPQDISGEILTALARANNFNFEAAIQEVITASYSEERKHLEKCLDAKKPFILPKLIQGSRITFDEYGEQIPSTLYAVMSDILSGIKIERDYSGEFKLFSMPEYAMVNIALAYTQRWFEGTSRGLDVLPEDGLEFEHWVSNKFNECGWSSYVTQGSGDQGVDVVAIKDGVSLGVQCKRYSGAVGNKAVQEAFSGAKHMGLDKAAVLTNADFTRSAKDLAGSTGVLLLSPEDIPTLSDQMELKGQ